MGYSLSVMVEIDLQNFVHMSIFDLAALNSRNIQEKLVLDNA
jgi:hypothetical protein